MVSRAQFLFVIWLAVNSKVRLHTLPMLQKLSVRIRILLRYYFLRGSEHIILIIIGLFITLLYQSLLHRQHALHMLMYLNLVRKLVLHR